MKNQYVGDIGDYSKLGLLRAIHTAGLTLGINWYLTPDDQKADGRHIAYLRAECDTPDIVLFDTLKEIVDTDRRCVSALEQGDLLKGAAYFSGPLDFLDCQNRKKFRDLWHAQALAALRSREVVFLDPDNGLEVRSAKPHSANGNKYATYREVADYFEAGASVIVYNHRDRSPKSEYMDRLTRFRTMGRTSSADIFCVKAPRFSVRDYLFIAQPKHAGQLRGAIDAMLAGGWIRYLCYREADAGR